MVVLVRDGKFLECLVVLSCLEGVHRVLQFTLGKNRLHLGRTVDHEIEG